MPPKRTLTFRVTIEGSHDTWIGRRERNTLVNVIRNSMLKYLSDRDIPIQLISVKSPSNEEIMDFQSTHSYVAPDWNAIAIEEREGREIFAKVIPLKRK
jgi:hypothetical protein